MKADPFGVSEEMRSAKVNEKRRFSFEELLGWNTPQQVEGYFWSISRKNA